MSTWPTNTSLKLKWLSSLSPFLQLEHMALILQIPLLNFNMGARHNPLSHCRYGDGYEWPWHAAYHGESKAVANFGHWYFIALFVISLTSNNRQTKGWLLHRRVWQQTPIVWQQTSSQSRNRQIKGGSVIGLFSEQTLRLRVWQQSNRPSGNRQNHCHTVDRAMSMGVHNMQHTIASLRQSQTMDVDTHLLCRNQSCDDRSTKVDSPSPIWFNWAAPLGSGSMRACWAREDAVTRLG